MDLQALSGFGQPLPSASGNFSRTFGAQYSEQKSGELTIVTAEGDRVTLSRSSSVSGSYSVYDRLGRTDGGVSREHAESLSLEASSEFSISVEGDLSAEELRDIRKAVHDAEKIMKDLSQGKMDDALKHAQDFQRLDTLSSLDAHVEVSRSVAVAEAISVQEGAGTNGEEQAKPSEQGSLPPEFSELLRGMAALAAPPDTGLQRAHDNSLYIAQILGALPGWGGAGDVPVVPVS